jgi:hypothetical protein
VSESERVGVSRRIAAPASRIFALVSDPAMHVEIDGSGMLEASPDARPMTQPGDSFAMKMDREPLGDIPNMGKYEVLNTVTQVVPDRLFEWSVGSAERGALGHVYGWQLDAVDGGTTDVTNYVDWSKLDRMSLPKAFRDRIKFPIVPLSMMEKSLDNLERLATKEG